MSVKKIVFTGGGTAGHVYPALAVIEQLKKMRPDVQLLWIGQHEGMEKAIVEKAQLPYRSIAAGKLRRYFSVQNFFDIFKVIKGFFQALSVLRKENPDLIFSKGGFVSVPVVWAASCLKIPIFVHESDSDSGLANRLASFHAKRVFVPYQETVKTFSPRLHDRIFVSGNPIREQFFHADASRARKKYNLAENQPFILVLGGSSGSQQVNDLVQVIVPDLPHGCFVLHQMGDKLYTESTRENYVSVPFIHDDLPDCIAASTLVISRSGAGSVWELAMLRAATIFIPLGQRGDQARNAAVLENRRACISLSGAQATVENLRRVVIELLSDEEKREIMKENMASLAIGNAAVYLAQQIVNEISA